MDMVSHARWMPNALSVPGMLHILDNAAHEVDTQHLQGFALWYEDLKNLSHFLRCADYRKRFIATCLRKSLVVESRQLQTLGSCHSLSQSSQASNAPHSCCLGCDSICGWHRKNLQGFQPSAAYTNVGITFFHFAYYDMVLQLHNAFESLRLLSETCACHTSKKVSQNLAR